MRKGWVREGWVREGWVRRGGVRKGGVREGWVREGWVTWDERVVAVSTFGRRGRDGDADLGRGGGGAECDSCFGVRVGE